MLELNFSSNLDWGWYIISIVQTASENIGTFNCSVKFFALRLLCISVNLPHCHAWNTVVLSGLVLLDIILNCQVNCKDGYVELLVHYVLLLLNSWLIVNMQPAQVFSIVITLVYVDLNYNPRQNILALFNNFAQV